MDNTEEKKPESRRIILEKRTIEKMIGIFCRKNHNVTFLCSDCASIRDYALQRLTYCPFKEEKPVCADCTVHCYKKDYREKVKEIMRFSGPRMIFRHPYLAVMHIYYERKFKHIKTINENL